MRKACVSDVPVSTSVLMSISSFATARLRVPLADDVEGLQQRHAGLHHRRQLAREERDVLLGDLLAAARARCFLTLVTLMPWRRSVALTTASPPARISPCTVFPVLSRPSHWNTASLTLAPKYSPLQLPCRSPRFPMLTACVRRATSFVGHAPSTSSSEVTPLPYLEQPRLPQVAHPLEPRLVGDLDARCRCCMMIRSHLFGDRHHLVDADAALVAGALAALAADRPVWAASCRRDRLP